MNLFEHMIQSVYIGRIFNSLTNNITNACIPVNVAHVFTEQKDILRWFGTPVDINVKFIIIKIPYHFTLKS